MFTAQDILLITENNASEWLENTFPQGNVPIVVLNTLSKATLTLNGLVNIQGYAGAYFSGASGPALAQIISDLKLVTSSLAAIGLTLNIASDATSAIQSYQNGDADAFNAAIG